jgi:hypothetical protein
MWSSRKRKGIAGIFVAMIVFGMLFTVLADYYLFSNRTSIATDQASASRQDQLLQDRSESLALNVALSGTNRLVVSAVNTGGVPVSITSFYIGNSSVPMLPPGLIGQAGTNVTAQWPITLNIGAETNTLSGCASGSKGCNIALTTYSYTAGKTVFVNVVTGRGNVFSFQFPPRLNGGVASNALVMTLAANPTQLAGSCSAKTQTCIQVTATVYNFASSPITLVSIVPNPPTNSTGGTASAPNGNCVLQNATSTITPYSGTGRAPRIIFACSYDARTGTSGGFASFSAFAEGYLSGTLVTSAEAVSNDIQIGGSSNVPTQGAFSVNFWFFRSSSCTQVSGKWVCPAFPGIAKLPQSATLSVGSSHYVAFYVQITNNHPGTLRILKYTFLQLDASHPPPVVGNETDFWLAGGASAYNSTGYYYPGYPSAPSSSPPTLAPYTGDQTNCNSASYYNFCIGVKYQQSVYLTLAACGYGASNWDWGGSPNGHRFDNPTGCTSSTPDFSSTGAANVLTLVISYMSSGQIYTQAIQFQGFAVTSP